MMAVYTTDQVVSMMAESDPESGDESNIGEDPDFHCLCRILMRRTTIVAPLMASRRGLAGMTTAR